MPAGKYYCDYCDKEFQDTPFARKRHLQGIQHQRNRALWYDSINADPGRFPSSAEGVVRGLCNRFLKTGACPYGDSCKYIHPTQALQAPNVQVPPSNNTAGGQSFGMSSGNLPPSLRPPPEAGYPPLPFIDWG